ncbi:MAG: IclR family transcriptional regulator domain-containing protein [Gemmatimonadales bacterium]
MTIALNIGSRLPAYCTSMGRVLLSNLPEQDLDHVLESMELKQLTARTVTSEPLLRKILADVRAGGWALVDQELEEGVRSMAAPIRSGGNVIAAMNISAHAGRTSLERIRSFLPELLRTAERISGELGFAASAVPGGRGTAGT